MDWEQARNIWERDGSLRDLCVLDTTLADWDNLLCFLRESHFQLSYSIDGRPSTPPVRASDAFRENGSRLLVCRVGRITLNCHFFCPEEIEFDLDALEIDGQAELTRLVQFMSEMGCRLKKEVLLTGENCPDQVLCSY